LWFITLCLHWRPWLQERLLGGANGYVGLQILCNAERCCAEEFGMRGKRVTPTAPDTRTLPTPAQAEPIVIPAANPGQDLTWSLADLPGTQTATVSVTVWWNVRSPMVRSC
jgi:hypothetical protein